MRGKPPPERRLLFAKSERWSGWFCERCCWNHPQPRLEAERAQVAKNIQAEFDEHSCETFARQHDLFPKDSA